MNAMRYTNTLNKEILLSILVCWLTATSLGKITSIILHLSKTIGITTRLRHVLPTSILLHIYRSLIHPYISYGLSVWGQTSKSNQEKILILQKRTWRLIYFRNKREHAITLFVRSNILPVDMLYFKFIATLYDINPNKSFWSSRLCALS